MELLQRRVCFGALACVGLLGWGGSAWAASPTPHLPLPASAHTAFHCGERTCVMPSTGAYPYLVIGHFQVKATAAQSRQLFTAMRTHHHWQQLPDSASTFQAALQPVAIRLADGSTLTVLMTREEVHAARPAPGDLVRYSPHRGKFEVPPTDPVAKAWWSVDGCVAILCRVGDKACFKRYPVGVYRPSDGVAMSPRMYKPLAAHVAINPDTLLPVTGSAK